MHQPFLPCVQLFLVFFLITHLARGSPVDNKEKHRYTITLDTENNIGESIIATDSDQALSLLREQGSSCFPAIGFKMPREPPSSLNGWWCDTSNEYAFVGFSYEVSECEFSSFQKFHQSWRFFRSKLQWVEERFYGYQTTISRSLRSNIRSLR